MANNTAALLLLVLLCATLFTTILATDAYTTLQYTPINTKAKVMRIAGSIITTDPIQQINTLTITTPTGYEPTIELESAYLNLFTMSPTDSQRLPFEPRSVFKDNQLNFNLNLQIAELKVTEVFVDMNITFTKIGFTDDQTFTSEIIFSLLNAQHKQYSTTTEISYISLQYSDTDPKFDLRYEMSLTASNPIFTPSSEQPSRPYRFSVLIHDTTRWTARRLSLHWVGPFQFEPLSPTPGNIISTTCTLNSVPHQASLDTITGVLSLILLTSSILHRGGISLVCPGLVVTSTPVPTFQNAHVAVSVITLWDKAQIGPASEVLDMRQTVAELMDFTNFPESIIGTGIVENNLALSEYIITYPNHNSARVFASPRDVLQTEWSKALLTDAIRTYVYPLTPEPSQPNWSLQRVSTLKDGIVPASQHTINLDLDQPFRPDNNAPLENFIIQQYAYITQPQKQTVYPVHVLKYSTTVRYINPQKYGRGDAFIAVVPRIDEYHAIATDVKYSPQSKGFKYTIANALTTINYIDFTFLRNFYQFKNNFGTCTVSINKATGNIVTYLIKPLRTSRGMIDDATLLSSIILDLNTVDPVNPKDKNVYIDIGDNVTIDCPNGKIGYLDKHPHFNTEHLSTRVEFRKDGTPISPLAYQTTLAFTTPDYNSTMFTAVILFFGLVCFIALSFIIMPTILAIRSERESTAQYALLLEQQSKQPPQTPEHSDSTSVIQKKQINRYGHNLASVDKEPLL